jgi:hypothetical protein
VGSAEGTSCRRVQSTIFSFQWRAITSRVAIRSRSNRSPFALPMSRSRSCGNDPLRRAGLQIIGAFSSLDVGDPTVPLTPRRPRRLPDPKTLRSTRTESAFPVVSLTDHGFHRPGRLPPSRAYQPTPDPDRTVRSGASTLFTKRPKTLG